MILLNGKQITPTIFPDGTSQIWQLPEKLIDQDINQVVWYFESEREIVDICSLRQLFPEDSYTSLKLPYLPYARQDKMVGNWMTFNLRVFADIINLLNFAVVYGVDAHNPKLTKELIHNFVNIKVDDIIEEVKKEFKPKQLAFPDFGASNRYSHDSFAAKIIGHKFRNQLTAKIDKYELEFNMVTRGDRILIVDDLCDGGATFIEMAKELRKLQPDLVIGLYVTHGIFSKGKQALLDQGIDQIFTTNSLLRNPEGYKV